MTYSGILVLEYKLKLRELRKSKAPHNLADLTRKGCKDEDTSLTVTDTSTGIVITPRAAAPVTTGPSAIQVPIKSEKKNKKGSSSEKDDENANSDSDLDPYSIAAIKAMEKKKPMKTSIKTDVKKPQKVMKVMKVMKVVVKKQETAKVTSKAKRKPIEKTAKVASKAKREPIEEVARAQIMKAIPKPTDKKPPPVHYNGGVIYTMVKHHKFRALKTRGDRYTEKASSWSKPSTMKDSWKIVVKSIDDARKEEK